MEFAMLDRLVERCREVGVETINGYYYPTAKNKMVSDLFGRFGFTKTEEHEDGSTVWQLRVADYKPQNHVIEVFGQRPRRSVILAKLSIKSNHRKEFYHGHKRNF